MNKFYYLLLPAACISLQAQTADFKKNYEEGNMKYKAKTYSTAIVAYDKAIALVQADADAAMKSKTALTADKQYIAEAYARRGSCYYHTGNYTAMRADADKAVLLDPSNADAKALLAYNQYKSGDKKAACSTLRAQISKGSEIAKKEFEDCFCWSEGVALAKEGTTQANLKRYDAALVKLNEAIAILPDSGSIYAERAKVYLETKEAEKAQQDINMAIAKKTSNYKVYFLRAKVFMEQNKLDSAYEDLNQCLNLKKDYVDGYQLRAEVAERQDLWSAAIFDYNQLIKMRPDYGMNYYKVAQIKHNHQDDLLGACDFYKAAAARGVEEAKEMAANCADPRYMKKNLKKAAK